MVTKKKYIKEIKARETAQLVKSSLEVKPAKSLQDEVTEELKEETPENSNEMIKSNIIEKDKDGKENHRDEVRSGNRKRSNRGDEEGNKKV